MPPLYSPLPAQPGCSPAEPHDEIPYPPSAYDQRAESAGVKMMTRSPSPHGERASSTAKKGTAQDCSLENNAQNFTILCNIFKNPAIVKNFFVQFWATYNDAQTGRVRVPDEFREGLGVFEVYVARLSREVAIQSTHNTEDAVGGAEDDVRGAGQRTPVPLKQPVTPGKLTPAMMKRCGTTSGWPGKSKGNTISQTIREAQTADPVNPLHPGTPASESQLVSALHETFGTGKPTPPRHKGTGHASRIPFGDTTSATDTSTDNDSSGSSFVPSFTTDNSTGTDSSLIPSPSSSSNAAVWSNTVTEDGDFEGISDGDGKYMMSGALSVPKFTMLKPSNKNPKPEPPFHHPGTKIAIGKLGNATPPATPATPEKRQVRVRRKQHGLLVSPSPSKRLSGEALDDDHDDDARANARATFEDPVRRSPRQGKWLKKEHDDEEEISHSASDFEEQLKGEDNVPAQTRGIGRGRGKGRGRGRPRGRGRGGAAGA